MKHHVTLTALALAVAGLISTASAQNKPENPCGGKAMKPAQSMTPSKPMMHGAGTTFVVNDPMNRNTVSFKSSAPLEDIIGTSNQISGQLQFDPEHPEKGGSGEIIVPVKSLATGIPLRDEHLASPDWLNAAQYPQIVFHITSVRDVRKVTATADAQTYDVTVAGDFSLHGVTKPLQAPGRITYLKESETTKQKLPGNLLAARTEFSVPLADFGITGPKGMPLVGSKVGEQVAIQLSLVGSSEAGPMAGNPCGGKKGAAAMDAGNPCGEKKAQNPCGEKKPK